jgi:hypothetical protein
MYSRWTEVRCDSARSIKTSVWLAFLDACTSSWLRGTFIVLTVLLDRRMYRYMCATTHSSRSSRSWSFMSGWFPASSVGLDCLVETAGIFRVFWAPARLWPGWLPDQNRRSHAPYLACFLYKWMQAISVSNVLEQWKNSVWLTSSITALDRQGMHLIVRVSVREVLQAWYFHCLAPSPARAT